MTESAHSHIGASGMHRWANCPGSVRLSQGIESRSSAYAEEGTQAHELAENWLNARLFKQQLKAFDDLPDDMQDAVEVYVEYVDSKVTSSDDVVLVEHKFDLSSIYPGLFGTADCVIYKPQTKVLHVIDYKHGQGIAVDPDDNPQLMYYGLGALLETGHPANKVELTIVQPRCYHEKGPVRSWEINAMELLEFSADLAEYAKATEDPNAPLNPGDWCRFCPAAAICPALQAKAQDVAKMEFGPNLSYDPQELAETLDWLPVLEGWIKNVREFAYGEAQHGRNPPGWKLVEKRPSRQWVGEDQIPQILREKFELDSDDIFTEKLKTPAQIEKLLDKGRKAELTEYITKQSSGTTLAPESDNRPAVNTDAKSEFSAVAE